VVTATVTVDGAAEQYVALGEAGVGVVHCAPPRRISSGQRFIDALTPD
jgi:hypothetical protein